LSLRSFHIFFICASIAVLAFLAYWAGTRALAGMGGWNGTLAVCGIAGLIIGVPYLAWFIRKTKALG